MRPVVPSNYGGLRTGSPITYGQRNFALWSAWGPEAPAMGPGDAPGPMRDRRSSCYLRDPPGALLVRAR